MAKIDVGSIDDAFMKFCWFSLPPSARARILVRMRKTAWVFGAGASHHYDLNRFNIQTPLANGFFEAFNRLPTSWGFGAHIGPLISFLEHYRGVAPDRIASWNENIENFMTSIESKLEKLRAKNKNQHLSGKDFGDVLSYGMVFNNMNFIFANVLNESQNGTSASLYHMLLETCGPNDSFITFNWDTLLDRALIDSGGWTPEDGYGVSFAAVLDGTWKKKILGKRQYKTNWKLLKLHGSTNWLVPYLAVNLESLKYTSIVPKSDRVFLYWHASLPYATHKGRWRGGYAPTCYGYYPPNIPGKFFNQAEISAGPGKIFVRVTPRLFSPFAEAMDHGVPSSPLLITPVRQKKYDMYASTIGSIWSQTEKELGTADRIVIVGYSFPSTDVRPLRLLRDILSKRQGEIEIEIVAPGVEDILGRIGDGTLSLAKKVTPFDMRFEQYLDYVHSQIPLMMREAAIQDKDVQNWVMTLLAMSLTTAEQRHAMHVAGRSRKKYAKKKR